MSGLVIPRAEARYAIVLISLAAAAVGLPGIRARPAGAHQDATSQPQSIETRVARVERGLLPASVIKGADTAGMALSDRLAFYKTPGVSVAVINEGAVEWARGYGVAEAGGGTPVTPRTLFQAASISKPVAAFLALRMVARGTLSLDEDVNGRLRSWKVPDNAFTKNRRVTLRELLSHTAGLTVHGFPGYVASAPLPTVVQVLDGVAPANTQPIRVDVEPGTMMRYSGGGFTVLQQLLVDVSGRPFPALAADVALGPLGMSDSTYVQPLPASKTASAASGHAADGTVLPGKYHTYPELAAAGLWTTPTDLARFAIEIARAAAGRSAILGQDWARQMLTAVKGDYGLGLSLRGTGAAASFSHGGGNAGFRCQLIAFVEGGRGAVVMTNADRGGALAQEIIRSVAREYDWPDFKAKEKTPITLDTSSLAAHAGRYEIEPKRVVRLEVEGGRLVVRDRGQRLELYAESPTRFFETVEGIEIEFTRGADGIVTGFIANGTIRARRLPPE